MKNWRDPKVSERQVRSFAFKVLKRLHALGAKSQSIEDVEQELWVCWCKTVNGFNDQLGVPFGAYLSQNMKRHINSFVEVNFERFHEQTIAASLDYVLEGKDGSSGSTLSDLIEDENAEDPEVVASRISCLNYAKTRLSERARFFVTVLHEQPQAMLEQVKMIEAKSRHASSMNLPFSLPARLTSAMIFDLMQSDRRERNRIIKEVTQLGQLIAR